MSAVSSPRTTWDIDPRQFSDGVFYLPAGIEIQPRESDWGHPDRTGLREQVADDRPHGASGQKLLCLLCMRVNAEQGRPPAPVWMTFVNGRYGPTFRHENCRSPHAEHMPESDIHKALKEREARTWEMAGATAVTVETWRPRARRRPDVLAVGTRLTVAGEIQHTTLPAKDVVRRQKALAGAGNRVVWTTDRDSADVDFLRMVPHLAVPALDDHRLYRQHRSPQLKVISGWTLFEEQRCGWTDVWSGTTRCPVTKRLATCGRRHLYPTFNPHAYRPDPNARFPCVAAPHLDHLLEGILNDTWRPYPVRPRRITWIPAEDYDKVVTERGGDVGTAERPPPVATSNRSTARVCEPSTGTRPADAHGGRPELPRPSDLADIRTPAGPDHAVQPVISGFRTASVRLEVAIANMHVFVEEVRDRALLEAETRARAYGRPGMYPVAVGRPMRDPSIDQDGLFGWTLVVNGHSQTILMPGDGLGQLRRMNDSPPCVIVNGDPWWWDIAATAAVPLSSQWPS
ncbi:competence protein CoiA family protein [Catenuloplanes atrovinosus]|uniref:Competence protein CoiA nuclease-like domain-containing protein n=1 Tax=Catenuloplanes atrovinosus TaxID=137266 RepID=A0AAE3YQM8_9ACTN|nr:competence protein CoiA family protein [Catenuloplanes atrovinosus]MDR7276006.1 hypothetical protein [Catenuloplanes atrovinosus]